VECGISLVEQHRGVATRFDKWPWATNQPMAALPRTAV